MKRALLMVSLGLAVPLLSPAAPFITMDIFYTQYGFGSIDPAIGIAHLVYNPDINGLFLSNATTLISGTTDPSLTGADAIIKNPIDRTFLVGGGGLGTTASPGQVFQIDGAGNKLTPFAVSPDGAGSTSDPRAYSLTVVPDNGGTSGFAPGTLITTPKEFGTPYLDVMPLTPGLAPGTAYPVIGDDPYVTGVAFGADGTAYYGSGTSTSNAGNFGLITFDGTEFVTYRLFGQPVPLPTTPPDPPDPRGGIVYTGTHRLTFDPLTGDIFAVGGSTIGQYDPVTGIFHTLTINGTADGYQFNEGVTDGLGHLFITASTGLPTDLNNGAGDLVIVDYSQAPGYLIDASTGVQYTARFLAGNLAAVALDAAPEPATFLLVGVALVCGAWRFRRRAR